MLTRFNQSILLTILLSCLALPCSGCGSSTEPVGVKDNSLEEFEQEQQTEEYIAGEKNL